MPVDELRDELLARARLAADHDGRIGGRDLACELDRLPEGRRHAEQRNPIAVPMLLGERDPELSRLAGHHHGMRGAAEQDLHVLRRERLGQIVPRASP